jgi:serine/threonine-protein kinase
MALATGTRFDRYEILDLLGRGGMGEVYLAQDTRLKRKIALKLLPIQFTKDIDRLRRFEQEAHTASALNHPNIITIYEFGEIAGVHFMASEFIEGQTLRQRMTSTRMKLPAMLDVAAQTASALAAAHAAGIVHRDIKLENIMLRPDGLVKVLDFGLAKLLESQAPADVSSALTATFGNTEAGVVMGTATYMSPEQARGLPVDARSDIFSLGVVLYELVTGRLPFEGATASDVIAAILGREPEPVARYSLEAPPELQRIISKALRKDREERYQVIKDLHLDLKSLREDLEFQAKQERVHQPEAIPAAGTAHPASSTDHGVTRIKSHKSAALVALLIVVIASGLGLYRYAGNSQFAIDSIAVLPFDNQNRDPDAEYLADGLTESIINNLTQLPQVRVIPRSSVFRYKSKEADPMKAGKELRVRAVLTGRIMQRGENLTISAELMDVRESKQLWGDRYERKVADLLTVQQDIAKEISGNLRLKLPGVEQSRLAKHYTENPEAYRLYLKGRYFWNKFTPADHQRAAEYFNQAIAKDPAYALAYTGLADTYGASATNSWIAPSEGYAKGRAAAKKALEIDEKLAEAHVSLGAIGMFYDLDWATAEREFKRAIELNPNHPETYDVYSYLLTATGRLAEGIEAAKHGLELDPLSLVLNNDTGQAYYMARRYDEAIKQAEKSIEAEPNDPTTNLLLGWVYEQKGMYDEAIADYQKAIGASERTSNILGALGHAYAMSGRRREALKILDELKETSRQKYLSPYDLAILYTGLGEKDQAVGQLSKAYDERAGWLINLKVEPLFDPLRSDPRVAALLRRMGLQ